MRCSVGIVRAWELVGSEGDNAPMKAASLVKQVLGHLALAVFDDLDEPILGDITVRHVLSHTTGLPNWRTGAELEPLRAPGVQWGYSGEAFVLLQSEMERRTGRPIDEIASERVFGPLEMRDTRFDAPEPGYHGSRPLWTTGADYGRFLAHVLGDRRRTLDAAMAHRRRARVGRGLGARARAARLGLAVGARRRRGQLRDRLSDDGRRCRRVHGRRQRTRRTIARSSNASCRAITRRCASSTTRPGSRS